MNFDALDEIIEKILTCISALYVAHRSDHITVGRRPAVHRNANVRGITCVIATAERGYYRRILKRSGHIAEKRRRSTDTRKRN